ncbi:electron transfer flavoprotein subunit beta [Alteribacillus sp. JSM 102045]|uniref:electron transfer flavoprotein subunit beta/FixA family protein n=1 Tax=Alteribacillus sp. JSM 102045 TaxID=1562101 RepID=UPI0035C07A34
MKIAVIVKQTLDLEEQIIIEDLKIDKENVQLILNPYDEYAVEEAVKLKEENGGEVTAITVGPPEAESALRTALAMGADKAMLIEEEEDQLLDENGIAKVLAAAIQDNKYDIILGGNMSVDNGASQVGPRVAEELDIPHISTITNLEVNEETVIAQRDAEGDLEIIESSLPILVTAQQGLNEPRYPSLPGIMKAKKKPLEEIEMDDLNIDEDNIQAKSKIVDLYLPPKKEKGRIFDGELKDQVKELVYVLREKNKVV